MKSYLLKWRGTCTTVEHAIAKMCHVYSSIDNFNVHVVRRYQDHDHVRPPLMENETMPYSGSSLQGAI
jgi:hypothetical protein